MATCNARGQSLVWQGEKSPPFHSPEEACVTPLLWENAGSTSSPLLEPRLSCTTASTSSRLSFVPGSVTVILKSPLKALSGASGASGASGLLCSAQNSSLLCPPSPELPSPSAEQGADPQGLTPHLLAISSQVHHSPSRFSRTFS